MACKQQIKCMRPQGERGKMDCKEIFDKLSPGFFDREYVKGVKKTWTFAELVRNAAEIRSCWN